MSNDNKKRLYDALSATYDLGTFEEFSRDIEDETKRKKLYDATQADYDYGAYEDFSSQLGFDIGKPQQEHMPSDFGKLTESNGMVFKEGLNQSSLYEDEISAGTAAKMHQETRREELKKMSPKQRLEQFNQENGAFMSDYEARDAQDRKDVAVTSVESGSLSMPQSAVSNAERKMYNQLLAQKKKYEKEWYTSDEYLAGQLAQSNALAAMEKELIEQRNAFNAANPYMEMPGAAFIPVSAPVQRTTGDPVKDKEKELYDTAMRIMEETKKIHNAPSKYDGSRLGIENYGAGAADKATDPAFITFGLTKIADNLGVRGVLEKIQEKIGDLNDMSEENVAKYLTPAEMAVLKSYAVNAQVQLERAQDLSLGYQAGGSAVESIPFMIEFALTGGIGKLAAESVEEGAEWLAKKAVKTVKGVTDDVAEKAVHELGEKLVANTYTKYGIDLVKDVVAAAAKTGFMPSTWKNVTDKAIEIQEGEDGNLYLADMNDAFAEGFADSFIEALAEGGRVGAIGDLVGDSLGKIPFFQRMVTKFKGTKASELLDMLNSTGVMNTLRAGGWHGIGEEYLEEWYGSALRTITGVDKNALKDYATLDNQMVTITSFLPLTIFGGTVSTAQVLSAKRDLDKKANALKSALLARGYDEAQANNMIDVMRGASPKDVSQILSPIIAQVAGESSGSARELARPAMEFAWSVRRWQSYNTKYTYQEQNQRDDLKAEMEAKLGKFWMEDENGRQTVQRGVNEKGEVVYLLGKQEVEDVQDGLSVAKEVAAINSEGKPVFVFPSDYQLEDELEMNDFLATEIMAEKGNQEQARKAQERDIQVAEIRQKAAPGATINIGTVEAPVMAEIAQRGVDGVIVTTQSGEVRQIGYVELGKYLDVNTDVYSDAELDEQEADALSADRSQREAALDQEYDNDAEAIEELAEAEQEIEQSIEAVTPLPTKEDGSVDQNALWNNDPERWAQWNDEQRQDGGANSLAYVSGAIAKEQAKIVELQAAYEAESDFDARDAIEKELTNVRERIFRLIAIQQGYIAQAEAQTQSTQQQTAQPVQPAPQLTEEEKAALEEERRKPLRAKAKELSEKLGVKVKLAEDLSDVQESKAREQLLKSAVSNGKQKVAGWYNQATGEVTIFLPHAESVEDVEKTFIHEVVAHKGLRGLLGEEGFNVLCDAVWDMMSESDRNRFINYPGVNGDKRAAADEYMAHFAETLNLEEAKPDMWERIVAIIKQILDSMGVRLRINQEGLSSVIAASYQKLLADAKVAQKTANTTYQLSDEVDENGRQFVLASNGEIAFGEISSDTGLTPAPILLSEGMITNSSTNDGYGLVHIEARHGDQIRKAGYNSVVEFIEEVAKNYEVIREGKNRGGIQTYMLQLTDKHNNTLMVELSGDGTYWNINTAGIFKTSYGANRKEVYNRHTTDKQSAETVGVSQVTEQSGTQPTSSMNTPTSSEDKVSNNNVNSNAEENLNLRVVESTSPLIAAAQQEGESIRFSITTEESLQEKIRNFAKTKEGKATGWTEDNIESIIAETESLIDAIHKSSTGNEFYDEFAYKEPTIRVDWRDGEAKPIVTWTRANIEYKYDMSADLLCINNEGLEQVLSSDKMVALMEMFVPEKKAKKGEPEIKFTSEDYLELYNTLKDLGFVVPCKGCFDAAGRFKMLPSVAQKFAAEVNAVIDERNKDPKAFDDKLKAKSAEKTIDGLPTTASTKSAAIAVGVAGDNLTEHVKWTQLMSADGQTKMLSDWGGIFRAWQRTGAGRPKDKLLPEPYYGDIVSSVSTIIGKYGEKTPSFRDILVNQGTGLRRNSHSEFRPVLAIDEIQFMRDAFIRNLTVFKYMKELDDVRLFGKMGVKFNMSFFPEYVPGTKVAGLDKDGNYIASEESVGSREFPYQGEDGKRHYDGMKGWAEAQKYINKDVSLSSVIFSIPHLLKALTDVPTPSDMRGIWGSLIPFHSSGATTASLAMQGLGMARANGVGHGFIEAFSDYGKGVTNFEAVQNDRFGEGWYIVSGKKAGENVEPGHKLEFANGNHYYNQALGVHLFASGYILDSELPEGALAENGELNITDQQKKALMHNFTIDYNDKVRELKGPYAYKDAADYYISELPKLGLIPRFDFEVSEEKFLEMCEAANVDPRHPKLGWKGEGNSWSPIDSEAYYSLFCDYGMTDPSTGEWAPHMPVGYVNEEGQREFRLPDNAVEIVKEGLDRFSEVRRSENARIDEAIEKFAERSVEKGRISQKSVDKVLGKKSAPKKSSKSNQSRFIDLIEEAKKAVVREERLAFRVISQENYEMAERMIDNLAGRPYFQRLEGEYELGKLASNYAELADIIMAIDANKAYTPVGTSILGFFAENPDMHFPLLFNDSAASKETANAFAEELSKVNDPYALFFMRDAWRIHKTSLEQAGLGVKASSTTKYNKAIDARVEEIKAAEVKGTAFNFKKQESSLDEIDAIFKQLNKDPELALLHDKVMGVARKLGVKVSFASKRGRTAGESLGDKVSYDYKFFNSPAVADQKKCNTITHELIHSITVYAIYLENQAPTALTDGMLEAVGILRDVYNQIARDPAFKGEYGVSDVYEMVAELSNAQFRDKLKEKNLFQRILDALKRLLGIDTVKEDSAYQVLSDTLDYIIENYDEAAFDAYALYASKNRSYGRMMIQEESLVPGHKKGQPMLSDAEMMADVSFRVTKNTEATIRSWCKKAGAEDFADNLIGFLDWRYEDTTEQLCAAKWFLAGKINLPDDDYKVEDAVKVAKQNKVDALSYASPMDILNTFGQPKSKVKPIDPDTVKEFSNKKKLAEGIVVYDVQDDFEGQAAVRKIIDTHWGEDANPWCLAARTNGDLERAKEMWLHYSKYPKRIAFRNGKLLAFFASHDDKTWWDRNDEPHTNIPYSVKSKEGDYEVSTNYELKEGNKKAKKVSVGKSDKKGRTAYFVGNRLESAGIQDGQRNLFYNSFPAGATLSDSTYGVGRSIEIQYGPYKNVTQISFERRTKDEPTYYVRVGYGQNGVRAISFVEGARSWDIRYGINGDQIFVGRAQLNFDLTNELSDVYSGAYHMYRINDEEYEISRGREKVGIVKKGEKVTMQMLEAFGEDGAPVGALLDFINDMGWNRSDYPYPNPADADLLRRDDEVREQIRKVENEINEIAGGRYLSSVPAIRFRVTPEQDKAYMDAVEAGDMETAQRMVLEAAKLAMPNTKVVDEDGNPKVVYHGTGSEFYTFRKTNDINELGAGYYFSDSYEMAERYATDETLADNRFRAEDLAFEIFTDEMGHSEEDYDDNEFIDDYNKSYDLAVERLFGNGHVKSVFLNLEKPRILSRNSPDYDPYLQYGFNHYNEGQMAKRFNDGVIDEMFSERHEGLTGNQYVAFTPSQIKSADPVTYDDNGNVIPLSERFNPESSDIRFRTMRTDEQREQLFDNAKEKFGLTNNFKVAGYMLPDGSLLDFSEANDGGDPNQRTQDHREVADLIMDEGREYEYRYEYVLDFVGEGAIRVLPEYAGFQLSVPPTAEQRSKLMDYIYKYNGEVIMEITDENGGPRVYMEYNKRTSPSRIFRDMDGFFNEGIVPGIPPLRFRIANENQEIFVSNAAKAVEGIKQEKATPEQWLKMIEKNGGLKAGEDKWMGLSDWLKSSDKKTLTKEEVLAFINENMIQIEEQHYGELRDEDREVATRENMIATYGQEFYDKFVGDAFIFEEPIYGGGWELAINNDEAVAALYNEYSGDKIDVDEYGGIKVEDMDKVYAWATSLVRDLEAVDNVKEIHKTRKKYTTRGLTNNHEIALTVPTVESWGATDAIHFGDAGNGRAVAWIRFGETTTKDRAHDEQLYEQMLAEQEVLWKALREKYGEDWQSKMTEADKQEEKRISEKYKQLRRESRSKILVIDEIQSKRHQEGREQGYSRTEEYKKALARKQEADKAFTEYANYLKEKYGVNEYGGIRMDMLTEEEEQRRRELFAPLAEAQAAPILTLESGIPEAPFEKNWHELAMKRMLRYAAENGYDVVAWTKGDQQAERYALSKVVSSILYRRTEDGKKVRVNLRGADSLLFDVDMLGKVTKVYRGGEIVKEGMSLEEIVGADQAKQIQNYEGEVDERGDYYLRGEDFRIGGEGMKGFYDKMLPAFMNKYGKKWGVKVEDIHLNLEGGLDMHSVPVTEEMKASVMEGQVMFRIREEGESAMDFHQSALNDFKEEYNVPTSTTIVDVNDRDAVAVALGYAPEVFTDEQYNYILNGYKRQGTGVFDPETKRIAIFVKESKQKTSQIYNDIFHENTHWLVDRHPELLELGEWLWQNAESGWKRKIKESILAAEDMYEGQEADEMLSAYTGFIMSLGKADVAYQKTPSELQKHWELIFNAFGYGPKRENNLRRRGTRDNSGRVGSSRDGRNAKQQEYNNASQGTLTAEERRIIGEYFPEFNKSEDVRFRTSLELDEEFGDAWRNQQNEDGRHSTQVANTKSTYEKIGHYLEDAGMKGASILDASSGLGLGTQALREMGFQVDDVEPFPSENREAPTFSSYADIDGKYDVVISNAVLNVIPDDWRADVLHQMADAVKEGGKMIINTRPASNIAQQGVEGKTRITLDSPSEILVKRGDRIAAYQKGFTSEELAEWIKSELGEGWRVEKATKKNSGISGEGTAVVIKEGDNVSFRTTGTPTDEVVANGLQLTPAQTAEVAANIFAALPEEGRKKITDGLNGNILGLKDAILQIPASLASKENWNDEDKQMADVVAEEMTKIAGEMTRPFSAEEGLWLLYNNLNKDTDLISQASRALVQRNLGFDAETLAKQEQAKEDVRFRTVGNASSNAEASLYNRGAVNVWTRLKESYVDMNASVEELVKAIEKRTGKEAQGFENILLALNQQSSKGLAAMESYTQKFLNPMFDEIRRIMDETKMKYEDVVRYVILKHGLERNKRLAQRDARAHYQEIYDDIISKITGMTAAQKRTYLTNAQLKDGDAKAELATLQAVDMSAMTDEEKREHKKKLAAARKVVEEAEEHLKRAQKIASMSEQEAQDELDKLFEKIENGTDSVYKEMRENDYSGISSMFYDQLGVDRKNFSTEEQYQAALMEAKKDRYSSLKDVEAAAEAEVKSFEGKTDTKELWKRINAATKETLRQQYEANMISKDQYDNLRNMFEFYVPLRGFKDNTAEDMYTYYRKPNSTGYTKPILGAEGRKTEAESPFGWIAAMAGSAIASNVKNEAKLALYYFVSNRPDNGIATISRTWFVDSGEVDERGKKIFKPAYPPFSEDLSSDAAKANYEAWQENMRELQKKGQAYEAGQRLNLGNAVVNISDANKPEHIVNVKVGGKDYTIVINGNPRAAQAINGDLNIEGTAQDYSALFRPVLRWMSSVNTSYNPEFWITNMMRDMAFTMMAVNIKEDPAYRRKFSKNYRKAFKVISLAAKNENGTIGDSYLEEQYKDFVKYGGVTGYTQIKDSETWEKEIENYLSSSDPESLKNGKVMRGMKSAFHAAHRFGESLEQVSRFAAFLTARETGKSINEAIDDAKEITVNFNRKGSGKMITLEEAKYLTGKNGQPLTKPQQWMVVGLSSIAPLGRRFIMFFNAAIQGLNATYKLMKKNPKRFTGWALGYAAVGMMNAVLHAMMDDDDDYLDIPQYERRNSLMIGGNGAYFKWALPQEARAFYALGDLAVETVMGRNPHQNFLGEALKIGTEILPVNPSEGWKAFMPSVAIPFIELALNEDYKGAPIYNEQKWLSEEEKERTAKWSNAYQGTGWTYVKIAQGLNFITGGDKHDAGWINLQPEKLEHLVQSAFGGTIRTADKFINTISAALDPEEPMTIRQTPFLNRFLTINDERFKNVHVNDVFDYYKADAEHALTLEKQYIKDRDMDSLTELRSSDEYQWAKIYGKYKKPLKAIQDKIKVADGTAEKKELMKQQDELKKRMIKQISEL